MDSKTIKIFLELSKDQAADLALFIELVMLDDQRWQDFRLNAKDKEEAYDIRSGIYALKNALAASGYSPR